MMITIRDVTPNEAEEILKIYAPYVLNTAITFEYDVPEISEFRARIINTLKKYPYIAAVNNEKILGYAYAGPFATRKAYERSSELSIYIAQDSHGAGLGRMLYTEIEARLKAQGIVNLYAKIAYPDTEYEYLTRNSVKFHEHMGFKQVGYFHNCAYKFGRWYSMVFMEKIIGTHN